MTSKPILPKQLLKQLIFQYLTNTPNLTYRYFVSLLVHII